MATGSRTLWKGAITFGLIHIPVALHTASIEQGVDFDWLDKRSMDPVGYKRINKRTGKEIDKDNIVKGVEYEDGKYVIVSPDEVEAVYPRRTQAIEIQRFVDAGEIPFVYLERPYYMAPIAQPEGGQGLRQGFGEDGRGRQAGRRETPTRGRRRAQGGVNMRAAARAQAGVGRP
jgi:Ku protein